MKIEPRIISREQENASKKENAKYPLKTYRIPPEVEAKIEKLRLHFGEKNGKIPSATKIIIELVEKSYDAISKHRE